MTLVEISKELLECVKGAERLSHRCAYLILDARDIFFPAKTDTLKWIDWGKETAELSRRQMFLYCGCGEFLKAIPDRIKKAHSLDNVEIEKIEIIRAIRKADPKLKRLELFLQKHRVADMDREEVRDAVNLFLGRRKNDQPEQMDFFARLNFPPIEEFIAIVKEAGANIPADRAYSYGLTLINAAAINKSTLSQSELSELIKCTCDIIQDATGIDAYNLVEKLRKGS